MSTALGIKCLETRPDAIIHEEATFLLRIICFSPFHLILISSKLARSNTPVALHLLHHCDYYKRRKKKRNRKTAGLFNILFGIRLSNLISRLSMMTASLRRSGGKGYRSSSFLFDILFHLHSIRNICISLSKPTLIIPFLWSLDSPTGLLIFFESTRPEHTID